MSGRGSLFSLVCIVLCGCGGGDVGSRYVTPIVAQPSAEVGAAGEGDPLVEVFSTRDYLGWAPSPDEADVARYEVFAVVAGVASRLGVVGVATHDFALAVRPGVYSFYVVAVDAFGVQSLQSPSVTAEVR